MYTDDKKMPEAHPIPSLVLLALGIGIMIGAQRYYFGSFDNPGPGFVPFFAGLLIAVFSLITLTQSLKTGWRPLRELWLERQWLKVLAVAGCLLLYSAFLRRFGFLIATILLMIFLFGLEDRSNYKFIVFKAAVITILSYIIFNIWLGAQLPRGLLGL